MTIFHYISILCLFFSLFSVEEINAQEAVKSPFPTDAFRSPLNIDLILSGTFGELRSNHFHSGIDIKTNGKTGYRIYAAADGYISRIKVQAGGYGNALYITHPNGFTSVYAHLSKFNEAIEAYLKNAQYAKQSFGVDLYLEPNLIPVKQSDIVAYSGNTGYSGAPHLHFEIRETDTEKPVNPLLFGFKVTDTKAPELLRFGIVGFDETAKMSNNTLYFDPKESEQTIELDADRVGFSLHSFDRLDAANNKNGVYRVAVKDNDELIFEFTADKISFAETRYINSLIHFPTYCENNRREYRCFREPGNLLSNYKNLKNEGIVSLEDGKEHIIEFEISDVAGNLNHQYLVIQKNKQSIKTFDFLTQSAQKLYWGAPNHYEQGSFTLEIPWDALYSDLELEHIITAADSPEQYSEIHAFFPDCYSFHKAAEVSIAPFTEVIDSALFEKLLLIRVNKNGKKSGLKSSFENGRVYARTKELGTFYVGIDTKAPTIKASKNYQNLTMKAGQSFSFSGYDALSSIEHYDAYIDGNWVLLRHDAKAALFKHTLDANYTAAGSHTFEIVLQDAAGNVSRKRFEFILK